jgi:hypothetical protein
MSTLITTSAPSATSRPARRTIARWMVSFLGFPLGGLAAWLLTGPVVDTTSAVMGGLLTGAILGVVQAWAIRADRRLLTTWTLATAVGLATALAAGASLVGFSTGLADVALQGAISGAGVGLAQAAVLWRRTKPLALAWPAYLAGVWAAGWTVTTLAGIGVSEQFTVFGSSGALVAALLTSVLPLVLRIHRGSSLVSAT